MSLFFDYFRKTLRFPLIWEDGPLSRLTKGAALGLDQTREEILASRPQAMPESCDLTNLVRIGQGRGVRQWPHEPDTFFRERVRAAYEFFMLGGKRSGLAEIIRRAGAQVEIFEPRDVREAVSQVGNRIHLDGSWSVDGNTNLRSMPELIGLPELKWAEFVVRINLAEMQDQWMHAFVKRLVYEYKPARSLPKFVYHLQIRPEIPATSITASASALKSTGCLALPCPVRLDGTWRLGRPAEIITLDGSWALDGFFHIGQILQEAMVERQVRNCRIQTYCTGASVVPVPAGFPEQILTPDFNLAIRPVISPPRIDGSWGLSGGTRLTPYRRLSEARKMDGTWQLVPGRKLAGAWCLDGSWMLNESWQPAQRQEGIYPLNGLRKIGPRTPESTTWPQARGGICGAGACTISHPYAGTISHGYGSSHTTILVGLPEQIQGRPWCKLAYKPMVITSTALDGSWILDGQAGLAPGATLGGSRQLDGSWCLDLIHSDMVPRAAEHKLDGTWQLGRILPETRIWPRMAGKTGVVVNDQICLKSPALRSKAFGGGNSRVSGIDLRVDTDNRAVVDATTGAGVPGKIAEQPYRKLALKPRQVPGPFLDGSWFLGSQSVLAPGVTLGGSRQLDGSWCLDLIHSDMVPRAAEHRLDGTWKIDRVPPETRPWPRVKGTGGTLSWQ